MPEPILQVNDLTVAFETLEGKYSALNGVDLEIGPSQIMGLVGESGCGKSSLALAAIGLLPVPPAKILHGTIMFKGENLLKLTEKDVEKVRGTGISMVFQEPLTSLNPLFTIGSQITEAIDVRKGRENPGESGESKTSAQAEVITWLKKVGLPDPERAFHRYPHELSGGMRQRVMIAMALSSSPTLMIADEPTSARRHYTSSNPETHTETGGGSKSLSALHISRPRRRRPNRRPRSSYVHWHDRRRRTSHRDIHEYPSSIHASIIGILPRKGIDQRTPEGNPRPGSKPHPNSKRMPIPPPLQLCQG